MKVTGLLNALPICQNEATSIHMASLHTCTQIQMPPKNHADQDDLNCPLSSMAFHSWLFSNHTFDHANWVANFV